MLMGLPSPVANVHLLAARTEASLAGKKGGRRAKAEPAFVLVFVRVRACAGACARMPVCARVCVQVRVHTEP